MQLHALFTRLTRFSVDSLRDHLILPAFSYLLPGKPQQHSHEA
jgi:hypothetical protein